MRKLAFLALLLFAGAAHGANVFVRAGASGANDGTDWTNAYTSFPTLSRGNVYYFADGSYSAPYPISTAESGSTTIELRKCTASDHGTETGYVSTYCDGQATLGTLYFTTGYFIVNGNTRNESSWNTASAYGFGSTGVGCNRLSDGACGDYITVKYVAISCGSSTCGRPIYLGGFASGTTGAYGWTFQRNYIYNSGEINLPGADNTTFEYNYQFQTYGKECIRGQVSTLNLVIRHSVFHDCCRDDHSPGEGCTAEVGVFRNQGDPDVDEFEGFRFYGNVIRKTISQHKTDNSVGVQAADCLIYNNTVYDNSSTGVGTLACESGSGSAVRNNIVYFPNGMTGGFTAATADNNSTYTSSPPFTNVSTGDFTLTGALAGVSLSSPYNVDVLGNTRGGDGTFDRGAYEYGSGSKLPGPGNIRWRPADAWPLWFAWWSR